MNGMIVKRAASMALIGVFFLVVSTARADNGAGAEVQTSGGYMMQDGVVTSARSGLYTVKTPTATYTLSDNAAIRHGHGVPNIGDEMTLFINEDNIVVDAYPKGDVAYHALVLGDLMSIDYEESVVSLSTIYGLESFTLKPESRTFANLSKGTVVALELNENGEVIEVDSIPKITKG